MDTLSKQGKVNLLTLPRSDLKEETTQTSEAAPLLMLVQLPCDWTAGDLQDAHFVAQSSQAALVVESKKSSFALHRVETSNVLILVPPPPSEPSLKRQKVTTDGQTLVSVPARLLKKGGSGASFLELRPKPLKLGELQDALPTYDPYNDTSCQGRTIESLARDLQVSKHQVQQGLSKLQAFAMQDDTYVRLSEEALQEAYHAIVSTLAEADDCQDYANTGIEPTCFLQQVLQRMSAEERFEHAEHILRHCVETLYKEKKHSDSSVRLSVKKVGLDIKKD